MKAVQCLVLLCCQTLIYLGNHEARNAADYD